MVTRRGLLWVGGLGTVALAGCLGGGSAPDDGGSPPDATHRVSVAAADDPPDVPAAPRVSVADPFATGGSPPVLRVDVDNPTDGAVTLGEYRAVVFQHVRAADVPAVLLPHSERSTAGEPDRSTPEYPVAGDGCWRLREPIAVTEEYGTVTVPAGGTLTAFVGLYGTPDAGDCLPTGTHRFAATYSHFPDGVGGDDRSDADWGFSLAVEQVDPSG